MARFTARSLLLVILVVLSTTHAFDLFKKKKGYGLSSGVDAHDTCTVVHDDVWEETCRTLFDNDCKEESVEQCKLIPQQQCQVVYEQSCNLVVKDKCKHIDVPHCEIVWEKKCVWERECRTIPSENPCVVKKSHKKGFLPKLWKRSVDKVAHEIGEKLHKIHHHDSHHKVGKKDKGHKKDYGVPSHVTLEAEPCEFDSEVCDDVEKCKDYPAKSCSLQPKEKCVPLPEKECHPVPREHCQDVKVEVCKQVPQTTCSSVPRKECEKQLVSKPREVCIPPPVVTVNTEAVEW